MLIKIGNKWLDISTITGLNFEHDASRPRDAAQYALYVVNDKGRCLCGYSHTKELAIKALDEAARKINAAQGFKPADWGETTVMRKLHKERMYCCSHCHGDVPEEGEIMMYEFCPHCGLKIESWKLGTEK